MGSILTVAVQKDFDLARTVCSYGYFVLAPNRWESTGPGLGRLHRPLRDGRGSVVHSRIRQAGGRLRIHCDRPVAPGDRRLLKDQVVRMLRVEEDQSDWWSKHPTAAAAGFGRIFRSPTLFEDIVKTITGCNVAWANTKSMNRRLCEHVGREGDFPTPEELADWSPKRLADRCRVGYRAERIVRLARDVCEGRLSMAWFEEPGHRTDALLEALRKIHGIGPYAARNILQALGRYDRVPVDSETVRLFREKHRFEGKASDVDWRVERRYRRYAPYQFKAYWFELWRHSGLVPDADQGR